MPSKSSTTVRRTGPAATSPAKARRAGAAPAKHSSTHDVVSALQAEHRYAALLLDVLEERLAKASPRRPLDREAMLAGMTYMTEHLDGYHHLREDAMFALLVKRAPELAKSIAKIKREHRSIGSAGKRLLGALQRAAKEGGGDEGALISGVREYVGAMREHMGLEERELFPRARQALDEHDFAEVDRAFMRVIDPIFEASVRDAYAAYSPVVRYLAEQSAIQQAVGALDSFLDSALTLGETLFGETRRSAKVRKPAPAPVARKAAA